MTSDDMSTLAMALFVAFLLLVAGAIGIVTVAWLSDLQTENPDRFKQASTLLGANAGLFAVCTILTIAERPCMASLCAGVGVLVIRKALPQNP